MATEECQPDECNAQPEPELKQEEEETDSEGLLLRYDVILCGTGLVQSILASAFARAGLKVLHCDGQGYYGELDAVLALSHIQEGGEVWQQQDEQLQAAESHTTGTSIPLKRPALTLHSTHTTTSDDIKLGMLSQVETPYGKGTIASIPQAGESLAISLGNWTLANGASPTLFLGIPQDVQDIDLYLQQNCNIRSSRLVQAESLLQKQSRQFAIDITPSLIFASGSAVEGFLKSGVADYLEFKSIEGLLWYDDKRGCLSRVPCSKGDVFNTKLLSPLEKRKLMKFLQLVMDFATKQQVTEEIGDEDGDVSTEGVQSLNERQLNQGRSLARPQNKAVQTDGLASLQEAVDSGEMDFENYLKKQHKLSGSLLALVRHALALETTHRSATLKDGMNRLCRHLQGLGRYGTTAFLAPLYGSGEFPQAFCRSAAVHGGTYLLRRRPRSLVLSENERKVVEGVLLDGADGVEAKKVACDHVVVSQFALAPKTCATKILRRVCVIAGDVIRETNEQRHVLLIPPGSSFGNTNAIHGLAMDASARVCPRDCTLLHLTTTVDAGDAVDESVLEKACKALRGGYDEIYHVCFSFALHNSGSDNDESTLPDNLHVCDQANQRLAVDDAFASAQAIFEKICPEQALNFLELSVEMDKVVKERQFGREDEDEERAMLDKASKMMEEQQDSTPTSTAPEEPADDDDKVSNAEEPNKEGGAVDCDDS